MCASIALALGIAEIVLRASGVWVDRAAIQYEYFAPSTGEGFGYTYKPNLDLDLAGIRLRTNSLGLKEMREPGDLDPQCRRILMVGGSITAGFGVDDDHAFPRRLEEYLNAGGSECYFVINAGQIAYGTGDVAAHLRALIPIYKPQLVIFELNQFAMNGPYRVGKNGFLINHEVEGQIFDFLPLLWHMKGDRIDTGARFDGEKDRWARDEWSKAGWWDYSFAYMYFQPKVLALLKNLGLRGRLDCGGRCLELKPLYLTKSGAVDRLPVYSPLYLSPEFRERFYETVNGVIERTETPIVFFTNDFFADPARLRPREGVSLVNLSEVVGMPVKKLYEENGLAWDFHLNEKGNDLVGRGLGNYLIARGLLPGSGTRVLDGSTAEFVAANLRHDQETLARFAPAVAFTERRNLHQVISGPGPDNPGAPKRIAVLVRKNGQSKLVVRGESSAETPKRFELRVRSAASPASRSEIVIAPGKFEIVMRASEISDGPVDLWLTCLETACDSVHQDLLGFE